MAGTGWTAFGTVGSGDNQFVCPRDIFVDGAGKIFIADSGNNRIVRLDDMAGAGWTAFGAAGAGPGQFSIYMDSLFVDTAGRIYVADSGNNHIIRIDDMSGAGWTSFGTLGSGTDQFWGPSGVFVR
jgi:streptogramin lyase